MAISLHNIEIISDTVTKKTKLEHIESNINNQSEPVISHDEEYM